MTDEVLKDVLSRVPVTRRKFVRRVVLGSAFAAPFVASFDMRTLTASALDTIVPNQTAQTGKVYSLKVLNAGETYKHDRLRVQVQALDFATLTNVSAANLTVALVSVSPQPTPTPVPPADFTFKRGGPHGPHYQLELSTAGWTNGEYHLNVSIGGETGGDHFVVVDHED